jgi:CheY-like chemotaxis protein
VDLHGGWIWVESEFGKGSVFRFVLPFAREAAEAEPLAITGGASNGAPLILVVEDDKQAGELLAHQLTAAGYRVAHATTGDQAVALARELRPVGITLDILLPDGDGLNVLAAVQRAFGGHADNRPATVLVVDDERPTVELLTDMLGSQGYRVISAGDGRRGIELARADRPDLIVLDLLMPEATGFDVVRELRAHPESREIPILIFSVKDLTPEERQRLRGSVQAIVTKGATGDLLRELARVRSPRRGQEGARA